MNKVAAILLVGFLNIFSNQINTVDSSGNSGWYSSMAILPDGKPVICYRDSSSQNLKVLKCGDLACESGNIITVVDSIGDVGYNPSLAIGSDGFPIISYVGDGFLKIVKCGNSSCSQNNQIVRADSLVFPFDPFQFYSSIIVGKDGLPLICFSDNFTGSVGRLKVLKCSSIGCDQGNSITVLDSMAHVYSFPSIALAKDGLPIIAYGSFPLGSNYKDLKFVKCGNSACRGGNRFSVVDSIWESPIGTTLQINSDGLPIISYGSLKSPNGHLKLAICGDDLCGSGNIIKTLDTSGYSYNSMAIGVDGNPVISYLSTDSFQLKILKCAAPDCQSVQSIVTADTTYASGFYTSLRIGVDGLPVVSYFTTGNPIKFLKVLKCGNAGCIETMSGIKQVSMRRAVSIRSVSSTRKRDLNGRLMGEFPRSFNLGGKWSPTPPKSFNQ